MQKEQVDLKDTGYFSSIFLDYLDEKESLKEFYKLPYSKETLQGLHFSFPAENRKVLVQELKNQYKDISTSSQVEENMNLLSSEDTFTVTTGHQLNLFTGPLFFVYKIFQTIRLAEELNKTGNGKKYVPVFWMASEDHDFDEIKSFSLFGKDFSWETNQKGPVGRFKMDESFKAFTEDLPADLDDYKSFYSQSGNLAEATKKLVNHLFGKYGLVILDADSGSLKQVFKENIKKEVLEKTTNNLVEEASLKLENLGYKTQIFPRAINLFYLDHTGRNRIIYNEEEQIYEILSSGLKFTETQILNEIDQFPEKFSPNVVLRPIYQQIILPNIAYCGGPAEVAYWLQLQSSFENHKAFFPVLVPRAYGLILQSNIKKKLDKLDVSVQELFLKESTFERLFKEAKSGIDFSFQEEKNMLNKVLESYKNRASGIGNAAVAKVVRDWKALGKSFHAIERDIKKAHEDSIEDELKRAMSIKEKLFPNDNLQERTENVFTFLINDPDLLDKLYTSIDPFDVKFNVFIND